VFWQPADYLRAFRSSAGNRTPKVCRPRRARLQSSGETAKPSIHLPEEFGCRRNGRAEERMRSKVFIFSAEAAGW